MLGGGAIEDEFADVLTDAAAEVEKALVLFLETGENFGVDGALVYAGFEEEPGADAGVGGDVPGLVALRVCKLGRK